MCHLLHLMFRCDGDVMFLWGVLWEINTADVKLLSTAKSTTSHAYEKVKHMAQAV